MTVDLESSHHSVLVGRYFHSFKEMDGRKVVDGQGQVVEQINDKYYLVRLDWRVGTGSVQQIITLEEMIGWHFYENVEDMREWFKRAHKEDNAKSPAHRESSLLPSLSRDSRLDGRPYSLTWITINLVGNTAHQGFIRPSSANHPRTALKGPSDGNVSK